MLPEPIAFTTPPTATKEQVRLWIEDLRSGKFMQAKGFLKDLDTGGYCCLGVYCARHCPENLDTSQQTDLESSYIGVLGVPVLGTILIPDNDGVLTKVDVEDILAKANDAGASFPLIAGWAETHLLPACVS